jgi:hypothetical protein
MYLNTRSPANLGAYIRGVQSPANLGFFRPNQAFDRGIYGLSCAGRCRQRSPGMSGRDRRRGGMGDATAGLPAGSILSYTATWPSSFGSPSSIVSAIQPTLQGQYNININSEFDTAGIFTSTGFTLQVQTTTDRNAATDVKAILDNLVGTAVGAPGMIGSGYGSSISLVSSSQAPPATGAATTPAAQANAAIITAYQTAVASGDTTTAASLLSAYPTILGAAAGIVAAPTITSDPLGWLTANWQLVALGAGVLIAVPLLRKL